MTLNFILGVAFVAFAMGLTVRRVIKNAIIKESIVNYNFTPPYTWPEPFVRGDCTMQPYECLDHSCTKPAPKISETFADRASKVGVLPRQNYKVGPGTICTIEATKQARAITYAGTVERRKPLVNKPHNMSEGSGLHNPGHCDGCGVFYD